MPIFSTCSKHVRYFSISAFNKAHKQGKYKNEKYFIFVEQVSLTFFIKETTSSGPARYYSQWNEQWILRNHFLLKSHSIFTNPVNICKGTWDLKKIIDIRMTIHFDAYFERFDLLIYNNICILFAIFAFANIAGICICTWD